MAFGTNQSAAYSWDPTNAGTLLEYLVQHKQAIWGFEVGNEVNNNGGMSAPSKTQPSQQADALKVFAGESWLTAAIPMDNPYCSCRLTRKHARPAMVARKMPAAVLIGPDSGYKAAEAWLRSYLPQVAKPGTTGGSLLHAVTHHVYDAPGRSSFNSPAGLDGGKAEIAWYTTTVQQLAPTAQIWAGEDGPTGGGNTGTCGGNSSVCTTFASALTYADDLGLRAKSGFVQYQRQSLFGGGYGLTSHRRDCHSDDTPLLSVLKHLINVEGGAAKRQSRRRLGLTDTAVFHKQWALGPAEPLVLRPGFWVNFLWKRLLGTVVHNVSSSSGDVSHGP